MPERLFGALTLFYAVTAIYKSVSKSSTFYFTADFLSFSIMTKNMKLLVSMVGAVGLEPTTHKWGQILSLLCIPIPPRADLFLSKMIVPIKTGTA